MSDEVKVGSVWINRETRREVVVVAVEGDSVRYQLPGLACASPVARFLSAHSPRPEVYRRAAEEWRELLDDPDAPGEQLATRRRRT